MVPGFPLPDQRGLSGGNYGNAAGRAGGAYGVWPIALAGGLIPNAGYSFWLFTRNPTWGNYRATWHPEVWFGCLMGAFWMGPRRGRRGLWTGFALLAVATAVIAAGNR